MGKVETWWGEGESRIGQGVHAQPSEMVSSVVNLLGSYTELVTVNNHSCSCQVVDIGSSGCSLFFQPVPICLDFVSLCRVKLK